MSTSVTNPWVKLPPKKPFVLSEDRARLDKFNKEAHEQHFVHLGLLPEPFTGRPDAPIVLLYNNPGYAGERTVLRHNNPDFVTAARKNLTHETCDYPVFFLDPAIKEVGNQWWEKKLRGMLEFADGKTVARSVLIVDFFPYHSHKFRLGGSPLPSQEYSFHLVRQAIERRTLIIVARGRRRWLRRIQELKTYPRLRVLVNPRSATVSPGNYPPGFDFDEVVQILRAERLRNQSIPPQ